jgi:fumarate hydratase class I
MQQLRESIHRLVVEAATSLPPDVRRALRSALEREPGASRSCLALRMIAANVDLADARCAPLCQDTGLPTFEVRLPPCVDPLLVSAAIGQAVVQATEEGKLRPNAVDPVSGRSRPDNLGTGTPVVHYEPWLSEEIEIRLILKGGGCENVSGQYALPCTLPGLGRADRDLEGVRKCVLHAVHAAQGYGCSVGILGIAVGGDRDGGYAAAKEQLFRELDDVNPDPALAHLEDEIVREANRLGIGTMGFGGAVTLAACKIGALDRLPASYFVTVAYDCWALRRQGIVLDPRTGAIKRWLYGKEAPAVRMTEETNLPLTGREVRLTTPLSEEEVRRLKVGDVVLLSGRIYTGRDALHHYLTTHPEPRDSRGQPLSLHGTALYHCGPVALQEGGRWTIQAAGPTTSIREEPYEADLIETFGLRAVIGKGGMGPKTLAALEKRGAVYLSAIGGAAQYYARCVEAVESVDFLAFGIPEAMWCLRVRDFPAVVTMDAHGRSLHAEIERASAEALERLASPLTA